MNCNRCKYMQRITRNLSARCIIHGMSVLINRFERKQLTGLKEKNNQLQHSLQFKLNK
ncbi:MAG: hypothetical protein ACYC2U_04640 [Candidatus Amoebophilus sp.]